MKTDVPTVTCLTRLHQQCTVPIVKNSLKTVKTAKMIIGVPIVTGLPRLYQQCTNRQKQSNSKKITIGVPIVTCLHGVRRIHKVCVRRRHKSVCAYQQCCNLANGNKTCPSLLVFKNNNMARGSQEFVCQNSHNSGTHIEQPSVLNKFFSELQYSATFGRESRKFAGGV